MIYNSDDMPAIPETFITWLNKQLENSNLSQSEASRRAGLNQNAISDIMTGKVKSISIKTTKALARLFGVPMYEVLQQAGHLEFPAQIEDLSLRELVELAKQLPEKDRQELLNYARWKASRRDQ